MTRPAGGGDAARSGYRPASSKNLASYRRDRDVIAAVVGTPPQRLSRDVYDASQATSSTPPS